MGGVYSAFTRRTLLLKACSLTFQNFVKVMSIGIATYVRVCAFLVHHSEIWVMHFLILLVNPKERMIL